ncbi:ATP-dependent RNA-DNA and DNA-DNA helicase protein [Rhizobium phage RHph_Y1_11]|nr:ATP-dependent RNA-DNA and DNA-DNA helicase protein [Rhizobium phage RHph_Y1_11]
MTNVAKYIMTEPPLSYGKTAVYPYSYALERKFRFTTRFNEPIELFRRDGNYIHLPRAVCPVGDNDNRHEGKKVHFPQCPTPRPNQKKMFASVREFIEQGLSGVAVAQTGFGKTILGYLAAYTLQVKTLVITTKEDIFQQWIEGARQFLGCKWYEVGQIRGDKCEVIDTTFCVALVQSLCKDGKYPDWIGDEFGLIIFDECHRMPADYFQTVIDMFPAKVRMGLSATPDRKDGKEIILYTHVGPVRAQDDTENLTPKVLRYMTGWECPMRYFTDPDTGHKSYRKIPHSPGKTAHIEELLVNDPGRNAMLLETIKEAYKSDRSHVVFSTRLEHLALLEQACNKLHGIPFKHMGIYKSESTKVGKEEREKIKAKPIIFTTYTMMAEGTNIPWLDTCSLALPRSDVRQAVGRIRREYEDKKFPVVFDFMDLDSPVFYGYANKRHDWYTSIGAEIVEMS